MWKFAKIQLNGRSPMTAILSRCSDKRSLRLAVYNLNENRVDCAAMPPQQVRQLTLSSETVRSIKSSCDGRCKFAILAYDMSTGYVYLVDCTPELNAASAVLLCVVSELIGSAVPCRHDEPVNPEDWDEDEDDEWTDDEDDDENYDNTNIGHYGMGCKAPEVVRRDARGRFVAKDMERPTCGCTAPTSQRRFRLGHRRG